MEAPFLKKYWPRSMPTLCLVCGVDSGPIKTFLIFVMGGLVLAAIFMMLWAVGTRRIRLNEANANLAIEAENSLPKEKV